MYYLKAGNILKEYIYSAGKGWHRGWLQDLKIVLDPTSSLAAIRYSLRDEPERIIVFYQGEYNHLIF